MAVVAMEVAWRPSGAGSKSAAAAAAAGVVVMDAAGVRSTSTSGAKKRAWGEDTQKLMHLMMGQFGSTSQSSGVATEAGAACASTLDLLPGLSTSGRSDGVRGEAGLECNKAQYCVVDEFLEVDPDQLPLPSGWEKCLDLKTGEFYFVSKSTGVRTSEDPRRKGRHRVQQSATAEAVMTVTSISPRTPARPAHEFLASKHEETLRASTSSGSSTGEDMNFSVTATTRGHATQSPSPATTQRLSFATGKRLWNLQLDDHPDRATATATAGLKNGLMTSWSGASPSDHRVDESGTDLELNLNLSPSSPASCSRPASAVVPAHTQTVCTMEMVQQALQRTAKAMGKREAPTGLSASSSSFSSLAEPSWSRSSPTTTTSSSSSTSKSAALDDSTTTTTTPRVNISGVGEAESTGQAIELVMAPCTRCLMFVMVNEKDPKCPRCESGVRFESLNTSVKRQRRKEAAPSRSVL